MGSNMVANLLKANKQVVLHDQNPEAVKLFADSGVEIVNSPAEVASKAEQVITMVPVPQDVENVYFGENGLIANAQKDSVLVDCSTDDPELSKKLEIESNKRGVEFADAPVTGAVPAARAGTLTFLVGGKPQAVDRIRDTLLLMGKKVVHCGPAGHGSIAKVCNNMLLAVMLVGTSEVLNLGDRLGMDPKLLTEILNISSGRNWATEGYNPVPGVGDASLPSNNNYDGGFRSKLMAKDLNLAQMIAVKSLSPIPMGSLAAQIYRMMVNNGYGDKDMSVPYEFLKDKTDK